MRISRWQSFTSIADAVDQLACDESSYQPAHSTTVTNIDSDAHHSHVEVKPISSSELVSPATCHSPPTDKDKQDAAASDSLEKTIPVDEWSSNEANGIGNQQASVPEW